MSATVSNDLLLRFLQATPEQKTAIEAAIERILDGRDSSYIAREGGRYIFRRSGCVWLVVFDGGPEFHIEDTLGARYLDYLLHHPNEPISAFDLEVAISPEKGQARDKDSIQTGIDGEAARNYLRKIAELRAERDVAADEGHQAEISRIEEEIEVITAELRRMGRSVDTGERARGNVSKAIMAIRKKLLKQGQPERAFGEHIAEKVSLGYECNYISAQGGVWQ